LYIANDIKRAIHQGKTIDQVLTQLDKRFKSINSILETLGISESTAVGSLSRQEIFKELGINKYQFYAKVDERTCETCGSMHGLVFPISAFEVGVTASPIHPRCRCWEVPILE
jgi:SPP1 gp7 family putative phage head morphogenesis protein